MNVKKKNNTKGLKRKNEKRGLSNLVHQAKVTTETSTESYIGLATNFKERYRNCTFSFRHQNKRHETESSKQIWTLEENNKHLYLKWKIIKKCKPYSITKKCNLPF